MARGAPSENEQQCLNDEEGKDVCDNAVQPRGALRGPVHGPALRVRFLDDDGRPQRTLSAAALDARAANIHLLKSRSSSEASVLLRGAEPARRHAHPAHNNNSLWENLNAKLSQASEEAAREQRPKDGPVQSYRKNCNVYSVNQGKTLATECCKAPALAMPRFLAGGKAREARARGGRVHSALPAEASLAEAATGAELAARALGRLSRGLGRLLRRTNSVRISDPDPVYKVAYLGNVLTGWARGETCIEKPLATLWKNYQQSTKPDVVMKLSVTNSGLKGFTKEHGLTEYWSHRVTYCASPPRYPKLFCWVYRHEGKKLKHELRCHAVLCAKESVSKKITEELQIKLKQALVEFKKDRISKQNARLSLANSVYENPTMPRRKILLSVGSTNYRPPLERSKSAPKLGAIEELCSEEDEEEAEMNARHDDGDSCGHDITNNLCTSNMLDRRRQDKSPRKLSCPEGMMERNRSCSDHTDLSEVLQYLVIESNKNRLENDSKTSQSNMDKQESRLQAIAESSELIDSGIGETRKSLLAQSNYLVTDSDDGSVSSGCETASTVNSDAEPSSLPSHFPPEESIKQLDKDGNLEYDVHAMSLDVYSGSLQGDCPSTAHDEVNHVPIGEKNAFRRRSTYPPLRLDCDILAGLDGKFESLMDNLTDGDSLTSSTETEVFKTHGDNDSACSDESGYSELLDNGKDSIIGNTIMV